MRWLKRVRIAWIRWKYSRFLRAGRGFSVGRGTLLYARNSIRVGENVYIGRYCSIECDAVIGNDVLIANAVAFVGRADHSFRTVGIPVRHAPMIRDRGYIPDPKKTTVVVGDDVWIGYGAIVVSGVTIGSGAVIAAGSVVVRDVPEFAIVAGVPAGVVGERFSQADAATHIRVCRERYRSYRDTASSPAEVTP